MKKKKQQKGGGEPGEQGEKPEKKTECCRGKAEPPVRRERKRRTKGKGWEVDTRHAGRTDEVAQGRSGSETRCKKKREENRKINQRWGKGAPAGGGLGSHQSRFGSAVVRLKKNNGKKKN